MEKLRMEFQRAKTRAQAILRQLRHRGEVNASIKNMLIHGDNLVISQRLLQGDSILGIPYMKGKVDLLYLDPPFEPWSALIASFKGQDKSILYMGYLYQRFHLFKELLNERGAILVQMGLGLEDYTKAMLDDIFGRQNFIDQTLWINNTIYWYAKDKKHHGNKKLCSVGDIPKVKEKNKIIFDQKPVELLLRLLKHTSKKRDFVMDLFGGAGTTAIAADRLGRGWLLTEVREEVSRKAEERLKKEGINNFVYIKA